MSYSVHPPPLPPPSVFCWGVNLLSNFQKRVAWQDVICVARKEGVTFFRGSCSCYIKNKLKSEIFNDKKVYKQNHFKYFSAITKNLNWLTLTKNLVTFKKCGGVKDKKFWYYGSLVEVWSLWVIMENQDIDGVYLNKETRFERGLGEKNWVVLVFLRKDTAVGEGWYPNAHYLSVWFFQYDEAIYLNDCVIFGISVSNRLAVYLVIQEFSLSQLYSNSN